VVIKECEIIRNIFEKRRNMEGKKYMGIIFLVFYVFIHYVQGKFKDFESKTPRKHFIIFLQSLL